MKSKMIHIKQCKTKKKHFISICGWEYCHLQYWVAFFIVPQLRANVYILEDDYTKKPSWSSSNNDTY